MKELIITLGNLGFPISLMKRHLVKTDTVSVFKFSFKLIDKSIIHIEAVSSGLLESFVMMREIKEPHQKQILLKGKLNSSTVERISYEIASLMIS